MPIISGGSGGGSAGAITRLSTTTLAAPGFFDVTGIDQTFTDLLLIAIVRGTAAGTQDNTIISLNNDSTAANYDEQFLDFHAAVSGPSFSASTPPQMVCPTSGSTANLFGLQEWTIPGYASTVWNKTIKGDYTAPITSGTALWRGFAGAQWKSTAAVTRVTLKGQGAANLATGSTLRIYGIS